MGRALLGLVAGQFEGAQRLGVVVATGEVIGQRVQGRWVFLLQRFADAPVQQLLPAGREVALDRLADQVVGEAIAVPSWVRWHSNARIVRVFALH